MLSCCELPMWKRRKSLVASEETFHQKLTVPGPVTVVWNELVAVWPIFPLRAAWSPSWLTVVWPTQGGLPLVVQTRFVALSASGSGTRRLTWSVALELVAAPAALLTKTE